MKERITSVHNPRIKMAARLRDHDERESRQLTILDGVREIARAQQAGVELVELFVCDETLRERGWSVVEVAQTAGVACWSVSPHVLSKLAYGERNEGLVAVIRPPRWSLADLKLDGHPLIVVLANVEKPGNIGAVARTADAAAITGLVVADGATDLFNPNVIRASLGTIFHVPVVAAKGVETVEWLCRNHFRIYAARVAAETTYFDADYRQATALVFGSEALGLDDLWSGDRIQPISIPMRGLADSLNVSVSAGILLYECVRQRCSASGERWA